MYLLQNYFDQMKAQTGQKSSNGTVLGKFFEPPQTTVTVPIIDTKQIGDDLGQAIAEIFKSLERQNNVRFNFTRKAGTPRFDVNAPGEGIRRAQKEIVEFWEARNNSKFNFTKKQGRAK